MTEQTRYLLVDGHSVIFQREDLRLLHARNTRKARQQLQDELARLHDTTPWRVTLVFDGRQGTTDPVEAGKMAVIYSKEGQTADSIIERLVASAPKPQQVHVVTADHAEALMVESSGAAVHSPLWLEDQFRQAGEDFDRTLEQVRKRAKW
ncbi:MAG: NYN domain-containing protein [Candidatus Methylacidiphilales bacterium]|nr:NYN domain-containing protein [Candidatus Methylacidiphilales bacterium]